MLNIPSEFIQNRTAQFALTESRVSQILRFTIECYRIFKTDGIVYDYSNIGAIKQEDFLRTKFVDDYMQPNIHKLNSETILHSVVNKESVEEYTSSEDGCLHHDPIDIQIVDKGLQNSWGTESKTYFAFECKRITQISDTRKYVEDIKKFTQRDYTKNRIPFEGQIAFVENPSLTHSNIVLSINSRLNENEDISTIQILVSHELHNSFDCSYFSKHEKKVNTAPFSIYHLFFDYSECIVGQ